jgi:2-dehydro-3-deoxyphosphogluconate aldolase/(4S)-4-hydroxy-2-oxoglutarate aldolase
LKRERVVERLNDGDRVHDAANAIEEWLAAGTRVIPVLAIERLEDAVPLARALVAGRRKVLEITLRSAVAVEVIRRIVEDVEGAVVGASHH